VANNVADNPTSGSPVGGAPVVMLNALHSDLNSCIVFSEPGAYATSSSLYLSIFCYEIVGGAVHNKLVLLKCDSSCDTANWSYIGTVLDKNDATAFGYKNFSGSDLFKSGSDIFLMVSPVTDYPWTDSYSGCLIFKFSDINTGILEGDPLPTQYKAIMGSSGTFNGACAYHEDANGSGFLYGEVNADASDFFRLFNSRQSL